MTDHYFPLTIKYTPHIGFCNKPFSFDIKKNGKENITKTAKRIALCLIMYQNFLAQNNHSQYPKSRIDFFEKNDKKSMASDRIIREINNHKYFSLENLDILSKSDDCLKFGKLQWFPQIPCKPFEFPVFSLNEAVIFYNALSSYDHYLLLSCNEMRVDYANMFDLLIPQKNEDSTIEWCSWYLETDVQYFSDFSDYIRNLE